MIEYMLREQSVKSEHLGFFSKPLPMSVLGSVNQLTWGSLLHNIQFHGPFIIV